MRRRVKLPGDIWDRKEINISRCPEIKTEEEIGYCDDYHIGHNLFDVDGMNRKIDFREFLRCETQDTLRALATRLKICNKIYIIVDSMSIRFNAIATRFYVKTLLQSYCFVRGIKDERPVVLVMNAATKGKILPYIRQYVLLEKSPVPI